MERGCWDGDGGLDMSHVHCVAGGLTARQSTKNTRSALGLGSEAADLGLCYGVRGVGFVS